MIQPMVEDAPIKRTHGRRAATANGRPALDREAQEIAARLLAVVRSVFMPVDDQVGEMPLGQLRVCSILFDGPRSMSALSKELSVSLSAMTQLADRLERAQLVKRVFEGTDRRVRRLQLTARGRRIIQDREKARVQQLAIVLDRLSPANRQQVLANLEILLSACAATRDQRRQLSQTKRHGHVRNGHGRELESAYPKES